MIDEKIVKTLSKIKQRMPSIEHFHEIRSSHTYRIEGHDSYSEYIATEIKYAETDDYQALAIKYGYVIWTPHRKRIEYGISINIEGARTGASCSINSISGHRERYANRLIQEQEYLCLDPATISIDSFIPKAIKREQMRIEIIAENIFDIYIKTQNDNEKLVHRMELIEPETNPNDW